jgi:hypothetical protein
VLIEAVAAGEAPALDRKFADERLPAAFGESSRALDMQVSDADAAGFRTLTVEAPPTAGGFVAITADLTRNRLPLMRTDAGSHYQVESQPNVKWTAVLAQKLYYKSSWQAWRTALGLSDHPRKLSLRVKPDAPAGAVVSYDAYFVAR